MAQVWHKQSLYAMFTEPGAYACNMNTSTHMQHEHKHRYATWTQAHICNMNTSTHMQHEHKRTNSWVLWYRNIWYGRSYTCNIFVQGSAREDSLSKNNREALKLYRKNMPMRNLSNTELRIWQQQLLDNISIWSWSKLDNWSEGTKEKHGSRNA